jgi:hypothetical protein
MKNIPLNKHGNVFKPQMELIIYKLTSSFHSFHSVPFSRHGLLSPPLLTSYFSTIGVYVQSLSQGLSPVKLLYLSLPVALESSKPPNSFE